MFKGLLIAFVILTAPQSATDPLGLDWERSYKSHEMPALERYKYYLGDVGWGEIIYVSKEDLLGAEAEVHLYFSGNKKVVSALLILGPSGIEKYVCLHKYKKVVSHLTTKYGNRTTRVIEKDLDLNDLVYDSVCNAVRLGLYTAKTVWLTKKFSIEALLIGDADGIYIEIEYKLRQLKVPPKKKREVLRRL